MAEDVGLLEMARDLLGAPFEERRARKAAAKTRRLMLEASGQMFEQQVRRVRPDDDEFSIPVLGAGTTTGDLGQGKAQELRHQARRAAMRSPLIVGYLRSLKQFVVGEGPQVTPVLEDDEKQQEVQAWFEEFRRVNDWENLEEEIPYRTWRDGEAFIRKFVQDEPVGEPSDNLSADQRRALRRMGVTDPDEALSVPDIPEGMVQIRLIPPEHIQDPNGEFSYGIITAESDVCTVLGYCNTQGADTVQEVIAADEMEHVKIRTDSDAKRGRSLLEPLLKRNRQYEDWLESRIVLNYVRSAVVLVRKVEGASPSQLSGLVEQQRATQNTDPGNNRQVKAFNPGTVLSPNAGVSYDFKSPNLQATDAKEDGREIKLSMAAGANMPEYIFTGDASNANFASTMVAESPGVREFESWQDYFRPVFIRIFRWAAVEAAKVDNGGLSISEDEARQMEIEVAFPPMIHRDELDQAKANNVRKQGGILSKEGWAKRAGIDWETEKQRLEQERQEAVEFTPPPGAGNGGPPPGPGQQNGQQGQGEGGPPAAAGDQETEETAGLEDRPLLELSAASFECSDCPDTAPYGLYEGFVGSGRNLGCYETPGEASLARKELQDLRERYVQQEGPKALVDLQEVIRRRPDLCSESNPYALLTSDGSEVLGCHSSRAEAERQELAIRLNRESAEDQPRLMEAYRTDELNRQLWSEALYDRGEDTALEEAHPTHGNFFVIQGGECIGISDLPDLGDREGSTDIPDQVALKVQLTGPDMDERETDVEVLGNASLRDGMERAARRIEEAPDTHIVKITVAPAVGRLGSLTVYAGAARLRRSRQVAPQEAGG